MEAVRFKSQGTSLENIGFVKICLMLLVIMYHACVFWNENWFGVPVVSQPVLGLFARWLNSFHIHTFAAVSGYLFALNVNKGAYKRYAPFMFGKAKRLLIPYLFVAVVWVIPIDCIVSGLSWDTIFHSYILAIKPSQLWFLWMLFGVFAIVWPLRKTMIQKPTAGWLIALSLYGIGVLGRRLLPNVFCVWSACQYVPMFYLGMQLRCREESNERDIIDNIPWYLWLALDLFLFSAVQTISEISGTVWYLVEAALFFTLHMVGIMMAWTTLQMLANRIKWKDSKVFRKFLAYSMPMYLFHQQVIYFSICCFNGLINPYLHAVTNFLVALGVSFLISELLMRNKTTRFLIGEK